MATMHDKRPHDHALPYANFIVEPDAPHELREA
jgi:hypothetical protein